MVTDLSLSTNSLLIDKLVGTKGHQNVLKNNHHMIRLDNEFPISEVGFQFSAIRGVLFSSCQYVHEHAQCQHIHQYVKQSHQARTVQSFVHLLTCILFVFLLISFETSVVYAISSSNYIQYLKDRRVARNFVIQRKADLGVFANSLERQQSLSSKQYRAISYYSNTVIDNTESLSSLTYVSQAGVLRATTRNLQQLQTLTITKKDNVVISAAMNIYLNRLYTSATSLLTGLESTMVSTINPIPLTKPLVSGKLTYFNANSTSIYFRSSKTEPPRERMSMCTGDAFGVHLDPITGELFSWGTTTLGRRSTDPTPGRVDLTLDFDEYIKQLACGSQHVLVLTNKAIYAWGTNANGEVGGGVVGSVLSPIKIKIHSNTITFINAGPFNSMYIDSDGYAYIWGRGTECQLGTGSASSSFSPVRISNSLTFTKVCFGKNHAVGRTRSGSMYYWGQRMAADGSDSYSIPIPLATYTYDYKGLVINTIPINQCTPTNFTSDFFVFFSSSIVDFQCGDSSTLALLDDGRVFGWGRNNVGQLGTNSISTLTPLGISMSNIGTRKITKIFHKNDQSYAVADDQTVWAWGRNDDQVCNLGNGRFTGVYGCTWSGDCRTDCGAQFIPDSMLKLPIVDYIHQIHIMKESTIILYTLDREMGFYIGGKFSTKYFTNGYSTYSSYLYKAFTFAIDYMIPYEKNFPVFDLPYIRVVYSENNFLSYSIDNMDMIMVSKTDLSVNLARPSVDMFAAFSFFNTHDFSIDGAVYYFGGIVNNTISNRIALKTSIETIQIFNQTLPYPVASGMLSIVDEYLYIFGGLTNDRETMIPTYKVMRCQLSNILVWEEVSTVLPRAIYNGVAQVIGDYVYLFGGRVGRLALNSDILYASATDMIWQNSYRTLPYPYTESNLFSDDSYLYMAGGFSPTYTELKGICRASKTNPLIWEDTAQTLPMTTMGITSTLILNNTLHLFSVDLPQNFLNTNPNVPVSLHSIYFANETKPYVSVTTGISVNLQVLDGAYTVGTVPRSCREYKDLIPTAGTGAYWIQPIDTLNKFKAYCDMNLFGGGWTLVSARNASNPVLISSNDYVKPDYSGNSISDNKWSALRSISTDIVWRDSTGYLAVASITTLSTSGSNVCKTLSTTLLDAELFRMEDYTPCNYGSDTCTLGASGNSGGITSNCGKINVFNPFKVYTFPIENYGGTKANMYTR